MGLVRLLGRHISYSASPRMQSAAFAVLGLSHRYELADVSVDDLPGAVAALRNEDSLGANVTVPHKGAVLALLDEVDELAREAGAVNTIVRRGRRLSGSNTDVPAIADEIRALRPQPRHVLVLGAGGAARGVQRALEIVGATSVGLVSRSGNGGSRPWARLAELLPEADLLINATPVGTLTDETPVPARLLRGELAVLDLVYRPSPTRLVREARAAGAAARGGAGILLGQGWRSLETWLGRSVPARARQAMAAALRDELGDGADV
ncbi:MAG TPA: shikimate dehydrogenase [Candidatus Limnocylindria bacterium]|nr:shikimate dehydrogenase [Candidatus Limnocylindria bacterium]